MGSTSGDDDVSDDNDDNGNESNDDDNADSDTSVESASGDSEDANSANGNDKATLNGLLSGSEGMENGQDEGTEMIVSFTKATYLNMWGIFAMLLVLNGLCCLMCFKKKSVDAIEVDDRASFV